jgi:hypothetical protein
VSVGGHRSHGLLNDLTDVADRYGELITALLNRGRFTCLALVPLLPQLPLRFRVVAGPASLLPQVACGLLMKPGQGIGYCIAEGRPRASATGKIVNAEPVGCPT